MLVVIENIATLHWQNRLNFLHLADLSCSHGSVEWLIVRLLVDVHHHISCILERGVDEKL